MWSSRLKTALAALALTLVAACGYVPAYAPDGPAGGLRARVAPDAPGNRNAFELVRQIEKRLGRATRPRYRLSYRIETVQEGVGVTPGQELIRYNVYGKADYSLRDIASGAELTSGSVDAFTGYSVGSVDTSATPPSTNATIATDAAERDAYRRLMITLGDRIVTRLIAASAVRAP